MLYRECRENLVVRNCNAQIAESSVISERTNGETRTPLTIRNKHFTWYHSLYALVVHQC